MRNQPTIRKHFKIYSAALLLTLVISILLTYLFQHNFNPENKTQAVQKIIHQKDREISAELIHLKNIFFDNQDSVFSLLHRYKHAYRLKGYLFRIKKNENTLFWSDNKMPFSKTHMESPNPVITSGNGWYRKIKIEENNVTFEGYYLIKRAFNYQNDYLENTYHESFGLSSSIGFQLNPSSYYTIHDENKQYLFSLTFYGKNALTHVEITTLFVLYLICFLLLVATIYELHLAIYRKTKKYKLFIFGFVIDILIIRVLIFYFEVPHILHQSDIFSPLFYAYSDLIPSLADLFLHVLTLTVISFFLFFHLKFNLKNHRKNRFYRYFIIITLFIHLFIFFNAVVFAIQSLIIDSSISIDLNNLFELSDLSFVSILIISLTILSYILITSKLAYFAFKYSRNISTYFLSAAFAFIVYMGFCTASGNCNPWPHIFVFIYILSFTIFFNRKRFQFNLGSIIFYVFLFSIFSTYALHNHNNTKEKENRKLLAVQLASEQRDPLVEYLYHDELDKISEDKYILSYVSNYNNNDSTDSAFKKYFVSKYFKGYWEKYNCHITICEPMDNLFIEIEDVEVNCFTFFSDKIFNDGISTENNGFHFLNYGPGENGYIAVIDLSDTLQQGPIPRIYVELFPKVSGRDLGFPDLLVNIDIDKTPDISSYSYAKYQYGEMYKRVGEYVYNFNLNKRPFSDDQFSFYDENGYNHLFYKIDKNKTLIISKSSKNLLDILAPFSYLFLFYIFIFSLIFLIFILPFMHGTTKMSFRTRVQISISSVILFSFIVIGIFTLIYIDNLNAQKNRDILSEKTHSVLVEIQHKFSDAEYFDENTSIQLSELLTKFSNVFFTDINLFNLDGKLLSSSRPKIYDEQLISRFMNPEAYKALSVDNSSLYIHDENIGKQEYLSAYIPFVNRMGNVVAYLNLPYFAKENDIRKEISTFLVAYINIYVILIAISILIAILISNYISRPIKMIMTKIRQVKLDGQNETIEWKRKDEIGQLVEEYNLMIDELARSAELLARSERESAWREMAKQIAHEIKNPLTPMKLSVQYLQRAWQNNSPDWENRLDKFTQTMIEQIDSLSIIASEFSDFAKMPVARKEQTDLVEIIKSSIGLFKNYHHIHFKFDYTPGRKFSVFIDKEQLLRALNNLLKNSIQAIGDHPDGRIAISLTQNAQEHIIEIHDNGGGIHDDIATKIFSPNFTTKSGGMGLGLAIVKNVIDNSGGTITYNSEQGRGTTFIVTLPAV